MSDTLQNESLPTWTKPPTTVTVDELRRLVARCGQDVAVLACWTHEEGYSYTTVGINRQLADGAVRMREIIEKILGSTTVQVEDFRNNHPALGTRAFLALLNLFRDSIREVPTYEGLTGIERSLMTKEEYTEVVAEIRRIEEAQQPVSNLVVYFRLLGSVANKAEELAKEVQLTPTDLMVKLIEKEEIIWDLVEKGGSVKFFDKDGKEVSAMDIMGDYGKEQPTAPEK